MKYIKIQLLLLLTNLKIRGALEIKAMIIEWLLMPSCATQWKNQKWSGGGSDVLTISCNWWVMPAAGNSENGSAIEQANIDKL